MKKMKLPKMLNLKKLSRREKNLLSLLGMAIVFLVVFKFIIKPQQEKIESLTEKRIEYQEKIFNMRTILKKEDSVQSELDNLHKKRTFKMEKHFSHIDQPQIIYILNELLDNEDLDILDIKFEKPYEEQIAESTVKVMDIIIPYRSTYDAFSDTIKKISSNEKRIFISDLTVDRENDQTIVGDIKLKIYGLEEIDGIDKEITDVEIVLNGNRISLFKTFNDYIDIKNQNEDDSLNGEKSIESWNDSPNSSYGSTNNKANNDYESNDKYIDNNKDNLITQKDYKKQLLEDFESEEFYFIPSNNFVDGMISRSVNSKSGKYSLRLEYNMANLQEKNRVSIDLKKGNIRMESPPFTMGIWVYAYNYSPLVLGYQFKGQADKELEINLSRSIFWKGWRYLEIVPPQDKTLYPLQLEKIYLESTQNKDDCGVLLFDKLEANYPKKDSGNGEYFDFYIVEKDDSLDKISNKVYGSTNKKTTIMEFNDMKNEKEIKEGRILVIPR